MRLLRYLSHAQVDAAGRESEDISTWPRFKPQEPKLVFFENYKTNTKLIENAG